MSAIPDFQSAVFLLAEKAQARPEAEALRDVVNGFSRTSDPGTFPSRASYNQYAASFGHQAFGYLLVEATSRAKTVPVLEGLPRLEAEERRVLSAAHWAFAALGARCLAPLAAALPSAASAVLPYARYDLLPMDEHAPLPLFDGPEAQTVVEAFSTHPALQLALETGAVVPIVPDVGAIVATINAVETEAASLGADDVGTFMLPLDLPLSPGERAGTLPLMCALVCLRASLGLMNEILYRQIVQGGPICVTDRQICQSGPRVQTGFGSTFEMTYGGDRGGARLPWHMERALVLHPEGTEAADGTAHQLSGSSRSFTEATARVRLHEADRWLNPAYGLLAEAQDAWAAHR